MKCFSTVTPLRSSREVRTAVDLTVKAVGIGSASENNQVPVSPGGPELDPSKFLKDGRLGLGLPVPACSWIAQSRIFR